MPTLLQKRFRALLIVLATAMLLCSCAKQPPMARMATVFYVVEAPDGQLNANDIASAATVQVQYASMAVNDTLAVTWHGSPEHDASIQTVKQIAPLNFLIPKAWITENLNRSVSLTYTYKVGGQGNVIRSSPITVAVTGQQQAQVFKVVEAPNGTLNVDTLTGPATVEITNSAIHAGDTVGIKAVGVTTYNSPYPTVGGSGPLHYPLANDFVRANIGRSITLTYTYKVGGVGDLITAAPIVVAVTSSPVTNVFRVLEAPDGSLNADTLIGPATVEVTDRAIHAGDTVGIKAVGVTTYNSPYPTVGGSGPLHYPLANDFVRANIGRSITLTYTYKVGGVGNLITSPPIGIQVTGASSGDEGARVARALNDRYATTATVCPDGRAAFYCSGVIVRTVDANTSFHAWNPSPGAMTLGGVSFSYMKTGLAMNHLQGARTQGLILKAASSFSDNGGYPVQVLCSFPYDGDSYRRGSNGCGTNSFIGNSGTCASQNITTLATWRSHFNTYPPTSVTRYAHQCSFATDADAFGLSLNARENPAAEHRDWSQNELVIRTWPQNTSNLPIEAFFYFITSTRATGLAGAQFIQRDFKTQTGRSIPVIKVTPNAANGQIFSYSAADQGI